MTIATDSFGNPILEQFSEEGFVDCVFRISDLIESDEYFNFHMSASSDGQVLGLDVSVLKGIKAGFDVEMNMIHDRVYSNGVTFIRSGCESDQLLYRLAVLYGLKVEKVQMLAQVTFTAIALHQGDIDLKKQPVKIKIFGRDSDPINEEIYNESFFNLDLASGFVYWNEKDQEYRLPLIRGLTRTIEPSAAAHREETSQ